MCATETVTPQNSTLKKLSWCWPAAGMLIGTLVMPLLVAQYPDVFNENAWLLPLSIFCVIVLFIAPLLFPTRAIRMLIYVSFIPHAGMVLAGLLPLVLVSGLLLGGWELFCFNRNRLIAALQKHPTSALVPKSKDQVAQELNDLANRQDWNALQTRLSTLEGDSRFEDVVNYFEGVFYSNSRPSSIDPDRYLSLVPQNSAFFSNAQRVRFSNWVKNPQDTRLKKAIIDTMERANLKSPVYFVIRLSPPPASYREVISLYEDFVAQYSDMFDFTDMKVVVKGHAGTPLNFSVIDLREVPGCVLLFSLRQVESARHECRVSAVKEAFARYDRLMQSTDPSLMSESLRRLYTNPDLPKVMEQLKTQPLPATCRAVVR